MNRLHLRVTPRPPEPSSRPAVHHGCIGLGSLVGLPRGGNKHIGLPGYGAVWGGSGGQGGRGGGGLHVVAVVPAVTAAVGWRRHRTFRDRNRSRSVGRSSRRFEFVGQDEFSELGASRVTLGGDVHVGGVGAQQPGGQQREGYTASAAMDLREKTALDQMSTPSFTVHPSGLKATKLNLDSDFK